MDRALVELVRVSNSVGKDRSLVLGGFGNTSVKTRDGKYMYIKASGTALKNVTCKVGWRRLKVDSVLAILKDKSLARIRVEKRESKVARGLLSACDDKVKRDVRPSIESGFHAILDRCVIHLHPAVVLAYACAKGGRAKVERLFGKEKFAPLWVPYTNPGYALAKRIEKLVGDYKSRHRRGPAIIFLQNHGLLVTADSANAALALVRKVVNTCGRGLKRPRVVTVRAASPEAIAEAISAIREVFFRATGKCVIIRHFLDEGIAGFMARSDAARLCVLPAVTPDELVYAGGSAVWFDGLDRRKILNKLNRQIAGGRKIPSCFLVKPLGLFMAGQAQPQFVKDVVSTYLLVRSFAAKLGGIHFLNKRQREFITALRQG